MVDYLPLCERAVRAGGEALLSWVGRFRAQEKGPSDLVTEADWASQEAIRRVLLADCPDHRFVSEETDPSPRLDDQYTWVIDPLDGTTNYVHGVPHYCVSVALIERGRPLVGAVLDPLGDECFSARRGSGAWLNGKLIRTSPVGDLAQALVAASFAAKVEAPSAEVDQFVAALLACQAVRRTGSAALNLAYVAAGRFDAFWALSTKAWDIAAGVLLVQEAGGVATHWDGGPLDLQAPHPAVSSTQELHERFCELLRAAASSG